MKIEITRGGRRYEVVPCGRRCGYCKPSADGDFCTRKCNVPKWWKSKEISAHDGFEGLREIGGSNVSANNKTNKNN